MILYGQHPLAFFKVRGSVFPNALKWAVPAALLTIGFRGIFAYSGYLSFEEVRELPNSVEVTAWALFTSSLSFLIVFRGQLAYSRFWEGITLAEQARGVWLNAASNLMAFCSQDPGRQTEVAKFQHLLAKLMSMLFCASLTSVSMVEQNYFEVLSPQGIDKASMRYLDSKKEKREILLQWVQRLIVDQARAGVIDIAPPILSRVFQELSIGVVHFNNAKKLTDVPFPFPFAQMVWVMISFFSVGPAPLICALYLYPIEGAFYTFLCVSVFWSIHYIAVEIEHPYGDDANDLPLADLQRHFNRSLTILLEEQAQMAPTFQLNSEELRLPEVGKVARNSIFSQTNSELPSHRGGGRGEGEGDGSEGSDGSYSARSGGSGSTAGAFAGGPGGPGGGDGGAGFAEGSQPQPQRQPRPPPTSLPQPPTATIPAAGPAVASAAGAAAGSTGSLGAALGDEEQHGRVAPQVPLGRASDAGAHSRQRTPSPPSRPRQRQRSVAAVDQGLCWSVAENVVAEAARMRFSLASARPADERVQQPSVPATRIPEHRGTGREPADDRGAGGG